MAFESTIAFFVYIGENFASSVIESYSGPNDQSRGESDRLIRQDALLDFREFGNDDTIFQEFDASSDEIEETMAWRRYRTSPWKLLWQCFKYVFVIQVFVGGLIGIWCGVVVLIDLNTADLCYEKTRQWNQMPKLVQSVRVAAAAVEGFLIQLWNFFYMFVIFGWGLMKQLNLLTLNLLVGYTDMTYRLVLQVFGIYKKPWMSYPLNVLNSSLVLTNGVIIARYFIRNQDNGNRSTLAVLKLGLILCSQFIVGIPVTYVLVYTVIPYYIRQSEINKVLIAGVAPLMISLPKVICRISAQKTNGIMHPGASYVLVSCLYSSTAIVFRVMQAELTNFGYFILLGLGHALIDLLERQTITMRDHIWHYLFRCIRLFGCHYAPCKPGKFRTPRSQRLVADMSIQIMLGESTALIMAIGYFQLYKFMYDDTNHSFSDYSLMFEFLKRGATGLIIDLVFNSFSVWLQIYILNVAVLKVWKKKWKTHALVGFINSSLTMVYFTEYLYPVVRQRQSGNSMVRSAFNCSLPFTRFA